MPRLWLAIVIWILCFLVRYEDEAFFADKIIFNLATTFRLVYPAILIRGVRNHLATLLALARCEVNLRDCHLLSPCFVSLTLVALLYTILHHLSRVSIRYIDTSLLYILIMGASLRI